MKRKRGVHPDQLYLALPLAGLRMPTPTSRATARRKRTWEAPAPMPWQCVILAVDTARRSGWSIYVAGNRCESGEVETLQELELTAIVRRALDYASGAASKLNPPVPCVLILEAPWGGSVEVVTALGAAKERWLRAWRECDQAKARVLPVLPSEWRGPVLGSEWTSAPRHDVRAHELRVARALMAQERRRTPHEISGHDEAAAVLIGRWATHAGAVGRLIGKRAQKQSVRVWTQSREASQCKPAR